MEEMYQASLWEGAWSFPTLSRYAIPSKPPTQQLSDGVEGTAELRPAPSSSLKPVLLGFPGSLLT